MTNNTRASINLLDINNNVLKTWDFESLEDAGKTYAQLLKDRYDYEIIDDILRKLSIHDRTFANSFLKALYAKYDDIEWIIPTYDCPGSYTELIITDNENDPLQMINKNIDHITPTINDLINLFIKR